MSIVLSGCGILFPGVFVDYRQLDAFVDTADLDEVGTIAEEFHFADSIDDSVLHYVAVFENPDALDQLDENLISAGLVQEYPLVWKGNVDGKTYQVRVRELEAGDSVGVGEEPSYTAPGGAIEVQFITLH